MSADSPDPWIDAHLRQVPVPEELLERIRRGPVSDEEIDRTLRQAPLPAGLLRVLREIPADEQLDTLLCRVGEVEPVLERVKAAVVEETLDERLRDVPMPARLASRMKSIWQSPRHARAVQWALALSLLLFIGGSYFLGAGTLLRQAYESITTRPRIAAPHSTSPADSLAQDDSTSNALPPEANSDPSSLPPVATPDALVNSPPASHENEIHLAEDEHLGDDLLLLHRGELLGQPLEHEDQLPELQIAALPVPRGIQPPLYRGFDREFLARYRCLPMVVIRENSPLVRSRPPVWTDTTGFDLARNQILAGAMPEPTEVQIEDFLAAGDYQFSLPPAGQLGLRTAAGPSPFGEGGAQMLLVGVQAGKQAERRQGHTHMVVAVDTSRSMQWGARLEMTRQALRQLLAHLEPGDRLSLVGFSEHVTVLLEAADDQESDAILSAIGQLQEGNGTHLLAGLQQAASLAIAGSLEENAARELVLVTDGLGDLPPKTLGSAGAMMRAAAEQGVRWTVFDLGRPGHASENLAAFTLAGGGRLLRAESAEEIGWKLADTLTGGSSLVAEDTSLEIEFNPRVVAHYRLLGHAPAAPGLLPTASPAMLRSGQTAVALYEVWLVPNAENLVATAALRWRDPENGESRTAYQRISRLQFALTPAQTPLPLATAQILAETAEVLGQSPYVPVDQRNFAGLMRYAEQVPPPLLARPSYHRHLELLKAAAELQSRD